MEHTKMEQLCLRYHLGILQRGPEAVKGGLLHKMYHVCTDQGEYAVKCLNPTVMQRPEAMRNMVSSERIADQLKSRISLVSAKRFHGDYILETDGSYYMVFDWLEGISLPASALSAYHCGQIGGILGKIHAANIRLDSVEKCQKIRDVYDWELFLDKAGKMESGEKQEERKLQKPEDRQEGQKQETEVRQLLEGNLLDILEWDRRAVESLRELSSVQVLSHRDLDPKNVMWKEGRPYVIDWEAAGYIHPFQELVQVLHDWIPDENGVYERDKLDAMMQAYTDHGKVAAVDWGLAMDSSLDGMVGWLAYQTRRAIGMEGAGRSERQEGVVQMKEAICVLQRYRAGMEQIRPWLEGYSG